jgi:hypothetical protein
VKLIACLFFISFVSFAVRKSIHCGERCIVLRSQEEIIGIYLFRDENTETIAFCRNINHIECKFVYSWKNVE